MFEQLRVTVSGYMQSTEIFHQMGRIVVYHLTVEGNILTIFIIPKSWDRDTTNPDI